MGGQCNEHDLRLVHRHRHMDRWYSNRFGPNPSNIRPGYYPQPPQQGL